MVWVDIPSKEKMEEIANKVLRERLSKMAVKVLEIERDVKRLKEHVEVEMVIKDKEGVTLSELMERGELSGN